MKSLGVMIQTGASLEFRSKDSTCQCSRCGFDPWVGKIPWRRKRQPTPVFLPGKLHGRRSLEGCRPWGHKRVGPNNCTTSDAKRRCGHRCTQSDDLVRTPEKMVAHSLEGTTRQTSAADASVILPASRTVRKYISVI